MLGALEKRDPSGKEGEDSMRSRTSIASVLVAVAVAVGVPVASASSPMKTKPHAGQACNPKKKAPTGFVCVKGKNGKYHLKKKK
jgi:hypothetical protein